MKISLRGTAIIYFLMAALFIYLALDNVTDTVWNSFTIIFTLFATLDLVVAIRFLRLHRKLKDQNKKK